MAHACVLRHIVPHGCPRPRRDLIGTMSETGNADEGEGRVKRLVDGGADLAGALGGVGSTAVAGPLVGN